MGSVTCKEVKEQIYSTFVVHGNPRPLRDEIIPKLAEMDEDSDKEECVLYAVQQIVERYCKHGTTINPSDETMGGGPQLLAALFSADLKFKDDPNGDKMSQVFIKAVDAHVCQILLPSPDRINALITHGLPALTKPQIKDANLATYLLGSCLANIAAWHTRLAASSCATFDDHKPPRDEAQREKDRLYLIEQIKTKILPAVVEGGSNTSINGTKVQGDRTTYPVSTVLEKDPPNHPAGALFHAIIKGSFPLFHALLECGCDIDVQLPKTYKAEGDQPSLIESSTTHEPTIKATPDKDLLGATPLLLASALGRHECVTDCFVYNCNKDVVTDSGRNAINLAAAHINGAKCIAELIANGVEVNNSSRDGVLPLVSAVRSGSPESIRYLLGGGSQRVDGLLMTAIEADNAGAAIALMQNGYEYEDEKNYTELLNKAADREAVSALFCVPSLAPEAASSIHETVTIDGKKCRIFFNKETSTFDIVSTSTRSEEERKKMILPCGLDYFPSATSLNPEEAVPCYDKEILNAAFSANGKYLAILSTIERTMSRQVQIIEVSSSPRLVTQFKFVHSYKCRSENDISVNNPDDISGLAWANDVLFVGGKEKIYLSRPKKNDTAAASADDDTAAVEFEKFTEAELTLQVMPGTRSESIKIPFSIASLTVADIKGDLVLIAQDKTTALCLVIDVKKASYSSSTSNKIFVMYKFMNHGSQSMRANHFVVSTENQKKLIYNCFGATNHKTRKEELIFDYNFPFGALPKRAVTPVSLLMNLPNRIAISPNGKLLCSSLSATYSVGDNDAAGSDKILPYYIFGLNPDLAPGERHIKPDATYAASIPKAFAGKAISVIDFVSSKEILVSVVGESLCIVNIETGEIVFEKKNVPCPVFDYSRSKRCLISTRADVFSPSSGLDRKTVIKNTRSEASLATAFSVEPFASVLKSVPLPSPRVAPFAGAIEVNTSAGTMTVADISGKKFDFSL